MLDPKESEEVWKTKAESTRKEDGRKEEDKERKECEAKLKEDTELLEKIERPHNKLMEFPVDGGQNRKQMSNATLNRRLRGAQALGKELV